MSICIDRNARDKYGHNPLLQQLLSRRFNNIEMFEFCAKQREMIKKTDTIQDTKIPSRLVFKRVLKDK